MAEEFEVFVGVDWGSVSHQVCVIGPDREILGERAFEHSAVGLSEMADWLLGRAAAARIAIAIETTRGPVVELLMERGVAVFALNPKQLDRFRDRHTVAGAKDDRRDAFVLADSLRTDGACFRQLRTDDPLVIRLREASRVLGDLGEDRRRACNRLRDLLQRYYPQLLRLSPGADEPWLWDLLEQAPTPQKGAKMRRVQVVRLLRKHRIRRITSDELQASLKHPALHVAPGTVEAIEEHLESLLPQLQLTVQQERRCKKRIDTLLEELGSEDSAPGQNFEHRDVLVLKSQPGLGRTGIATMLAEAAQPLGQRDYNTLRAISGVAPVTRQTGVQGKRRRNGRRPPPPATMRRACSARLRETLFHWARVAAQVDELCKKHYATLRARGHSHGRALRGVGDRLLRNLMAMLRAGSLYDQSRQKGAIARLAA